MANIILVTIGIMLFLFSEHQINRMTKQTRVSIRLAFSLNALAGVCFAAQAFIETCVVPLALGLCLTGTALLIIGNRRKDCIFGCRPNDAFWRKRQCERQQQDAN